MAPTEPIRIARIITRLNIGGPAIQAVSLSERLESIGYHTLLVHGTVGADEGDMSYLIPAGHRFAIDCVGTLRRPVAPVADSVTLATLVRRLRQFQPHIVHTHMAKAGSIGRFAAMIANAASPRRARARIVHTYHGHVLDGYFSAGAARAFAAAERTLARRSDALIAVSPAIKDELIQVHGIGRPDRLHVVPLGFDLQRFAALNPSDRIAARRQLGIEPHARVVSLVGRLTAIKQPELFLNVAARVANADPDAMFVIAGGGELESALRAEAARTSLDRRIRFLGWQRDMAPIYAASDLVAVTSRNEGTPVALIESMAASVPGVAFAVGGVPDVITTSDIGALARANDVDDFAARTIALLRDDAARRVMGERARADVLQRYGLDRLVRDVDALYRQLL